MCSWAKCLTLTVPLSTQEHKWLLAELLGQPGTVRQGCLQWTSIPATGEHTHQDLLTIPIHLHWNRLTFHGTQLPVHFV